MSSPAATEIRHERTAVSSTKPALRIPTTPAHELLTTFFAAGGRQRNLLSALQLRYERFGPVVALRGSRGRHVHFFGPAANRFVLTDPEQVFSARTPGTGGFAAMFAGGLLLLDGEQHADDRRLLHSCFTRQALHTYVDSLNDSVERAVARWQHDGLSGPIHHRLEGLTFEIAAQLVLGVTIGPDDREVRRAFDSMVAASTARVRLPISGTTFERGLRGRATIQKLLIDLLPERRRGLGTDLFSRLCRARDAEGRQLDDPQIVDHVAFLLLAAHETTASALTSIIYELGKHPVWQERARDASRALSTPTPDLDQLDGLESLSWVLRETLRRYPPLPVLERVAVRRFEWSGFTIREGTRVVIAPIHTHHMAQYWRQPSSFDPERFSPGRAEDTRHSHLWVPFGGGTHGCLGKRFAEIQVRAIVHQLLMQFRWRLPDDYEMPVEPCPISKPTDGLPVYLERL